MKVASEIKLEFRTLNRCRRCQRRKAPYEGTTDKLANKFMTEILFSDDPSFKPDSNELQKDVADLMPHLVPIASADGDQSPMYGNKAQQLRDKWSEGMDFNPQKMIQEDIK